MLSITNSLISATGVGLQAMMNVTTTTAATINTAAGTSLMCGDQVDDWYNDAWGVMFPLFLSLGFALLIEMAMVSHMTTRGPVSGAVSEMTFIVSCMGYV